MFDFRKKKNQKLVAVIALVLIAAMVLTTVISVLV